MERFHTHLYSFPLKREIGVPMKWKGTSNAGKNWTQAEVKQMRQEAKENTPTRVIAGHLGRSPDAVYAKAAEKRISLAPPNQSPYNRQKKGR